MELQLEAPGAEATIQDAVSLVAPQAQKRGVELRSRVASSTAVLADRGKLRRCF